MEVLQLQRLLNDRSVGRVLLGGQVGKTLSTKAQFLVQRFVEVHRRAVVSARELALLDDARVFLSRLLLGFIAQRGFIVVRIVVKWLDLPLGGGKPLFFLLQQVAAEVLFEVALAGELLCAVFPGALERSFSGVAADVDGQV